MANYFRRTIKLDEGCLYQRRVFIDCKRYVSKDRRWRIAVTDAFEPWKFVPGTAIIGDRAAIKAKLVEILSE